MIRILLADDHEIFLQGLVSLLRRESDINVLSTYPDGLRAWEAIQKEKPEIAVLDFRMPHMNGIEVAREVQKNALDTRIILLTMHDDPLLVAEAIGARVKGYVVKETAFENLVLAIKTVAKGDNFVPPELQEQQEFLAQNGRVVHLSGQERLVLVAIAEGQTNKEIARKLDISPKTVETYRARIMEKLDLHSIAELTRYAIRIGLID